MGVCMKDFQFPEIHVKCPLCTFEAEIPLHFTRVREIIKVEEWESPGGVPKYYQISVAKYTYVYEKKTDYSTDYRTLVSHIYQCPECDCIFDIRDNRVIVGKGLTIQYKLKDIKKEITSSARNATSRKRRELHVQHCDSTGTG